jgi:hypothetical protein
MNKTEHVAKEQSFAKVECELHSIRLKTRAISNKLYFLQEVLTGLARDGVEGRQLYPEAIRGLVQYLNQLSEDASKVSCTACLLLGIDENTVEEEFQ